MTWWIWDDGWVEVTSLDQLFPGEDEPVVEAEPVLEIEYEDEG